MKNKRIKLIPIEQEKEVKKKAKAEFIAATSYELWYRCSECHFLFSKSIGSSGRWNACPNCDCIFTN